MNFRQLVSFFLAILLGLSSVDAYIPKHLGGEGTQEQKSALQVEIAILLREDGTPRCRIGKNPSEYLTAEKLDEFYRQGLDIDSAGLDTLRECDKGDEIYAISVLGSEKISLGMTAPPVVIETLSLAWTTGKVALPVLGIGFFSSCFSTELITAIGDYRRSTFTGVLAGIFTGSVVLVGGFIGGFIWSGALINGVTQAGALKALSIGI